MVQEFDSSKVGRDVPPLNTGREAYEWNLSQIATFSKFAHQIARVNGMPIEIYRAFLNAYRKTPIVLWKDDIRLAAISGYEHFKDHTLAVDALRPPSQLWINATDVETTEQNRRDMQQLGIPTGFTFASVLVRIENDKLFSAFIFGPSAELISSVSVEQMRQVFRSGEWPDVYVPRIRIMSRSLTAVDDADAKTHAMIEFLNLPLVTLEKERLPRPDRRRLEKANEPEPELHVIALRKRTSSGDSGQSKEVDWNCRWIVGGHWRKQWCPSTKTHRPTFIAPYVKGPDDKPLKTDSGEKVYMVVR